jgi:hypothetical protein
LGSTTASALCAQWMIGMTHKRKSEILHEKAMEEMEEETKSITSQPKRLDDSMDIPF